MLGGFILGATRDAAAEDKTSCDSVLMTSWDSVLLPPLVPDAFGLLTVRT